MASISLATGAPQRAVVTDPGQTSRRYAALSRYCRGSLLCGSDFLCTSSGECHASTAAKAGVSFYEGVMSYLGRHYDTANGPRRAPLRVLVVPMEDGGHHQHVTLTQRRRDIRQIADIPFRQRNPHMRGVTLALRLAFDHRLAEDPAGEYLDTPLGQVHLFDAFAMANLTLCSATATGTRSSRTTPVMRQSCLRHLAATIGILEPTLLISQGTRLSRPLRSLLTVDERDGAQVATCRLDEHRFIWVDLRHPTFNWDWLSRPYLHQVAAPAIRSGRRRALALTR